METPSQRQISRNFELHDIMEHISADMERRVFPDLNRNRDRSIILKQVISSVIEPRDMYGADRVWGAFSSALEKCFKKSEDGGMVDVFDLCCNLIIELSKRGLGLVDVNKLIAENREIGNRNSAEFYERLFSNVRRESVIRPELLDNVRLESAHWERAWLHEALGRGETNEDS